MTPVFIVGGLFVLWRILVAQQASILANTPPPSAGVTVTGQPVNLGTSNPLQTDTEITAGLGYATKAISAIPVIGQIAGPIFGGLTKVAGLFTAAHAQAVKQEAQVMSGAAPQFVATCEQTMAALNRGEITPQQAVSALAQAQTSYYSAVSGIIKKSGPCKPPDYTTVSGPGDSTSHPTTFSGNDCGIYVGDWADCALGGSCNAACGVACGLVEPTVASLTRIIQQGGGTYVIPSWSPAASSLVGAATPQVTVVYKPYIAPTPESLGTILFHDIGL